MEVAYIKHLSNLCERNPSPYKFMNLFKAWFFGLLWVWKVR